MKDIPSAAREPYSRAWCGLAALAGVVAVIVSRAFLPGFALHSDPQGYPSWIAAYMRFQEALVRWPGDLLACIVLLAVIVALRFRPKSCWFSFALGGLAAESVLRALR